MHKTIQQGCCDNPHVVGKCVPLKAKSFILPKMGQLEGRATFELSSG